MRENSSNESDDSKLEWGEDNATLLVNSATCNNVSPSDICKSISVPDKKKPPDESNKKRIIKGNKTKLSAKEESDEEIALNERTYQAINTTVTYFLSKHDRTHAQSLVNRGANGEVAGEDIRVICKYPDRKICIRGINNHEIIDVPSIAAGGVT